MDLEHDLTKVEKAQMVVERQCTLKVWQTEQRFKNQVSGENHQLNMVILEKEQEILYLGEKGKSQEREIASLQSELAERPTEIQTKVYVN